MTWRNTKRSLHQVHLTYGLDEVLVRGKVLVTNVPGQATTADEAVSFTYKAISALRVFDGFVSVLVGAWEIELVFDQDFAFPPVPGVKPTEEDEPRIAAALAKAAEHFAALHQRMASASQH